MNGVARAHGITPLMIALVKESKDWTHVTSRLASYAKTGILETGMMSPALGLYMC